LVDVDVPDGIKNSEVEVGLPVVLVCVAIHSWIGANLVNAAKSSTRKRMTFLIENCCSSLHWFSFRILSNQNSRI